MSYYLLNNKNPRARGGFHGYASRNKPVSAIVLHTAENNPSSNSAVAIGQYFSRTDRQASYHTVVDSSQALRLLPWGYTAFHVRGANSWTLGLSFATRASLWGNAPGWDNQAIEHGAKEAATMCKAYGIPVRLISAADARRGVKGFTTHGAMDPGRRSDPGAGFPMQKFLDRVRYYLTGATGPGPDLEEESETMKFDEKSERVEELQDAINLHLWLSGGGYDGGGKSYSADEAAKRAAGSHLKKDGHLGPKTADALWHALRRALIVLQDPETKSPRSFYVDHKNPTPIAISYLVSDVVRRLDANKRKA